MIHNNAIAKYSIKPTTWKFVVGFIIGSFAMHVYSYAEITRLKNMVKYYEGYINYKNKYIINNTLKLVATEASKYKFHRDICISIIMYLVMILTICIKYRFVEVYRLLIYLLKK